MTKHVGSSIIARHFEQNVEFEILKNGAKDVDGIQGAVRAFKLDATMQARNA